MESSQSNFTERPGTTPMSEIDEEIAKQLEDNERFRSNGNRFGLKQSLAHLRKLQRERRRGNGRK